MIVAAAKDVGLAGRGDAAALRRLRDHWLALVEGDAVNPLLPRSEALPQLELLAELAANGSDEAEDWIALLIAYHVRVEALQRDALASEALAKQAAEADDLDRADRWTRSVVEFNDRREHYRAKVGALLASIFASEAAEGSAMLVVALSSQADSGDERAVVLLQRVMDSVTPARAQAIRAEVLRIEGATVQ